jgi:hypothetical protein
MSDVTIPEAAETPLPDMIRDLVQELKAGWRLKAEAPDGLASHSCGRALSAEVGRILASEWPLMRDPRPDETLADYVNQIPQFAEVVVVGVVARLIERAKAEERERSAMIADAEFEAMKRLDMEHHKIHATKSAEICGAKARTAESIAQAIRSSHE